MSIKKQSNGTYSVRVSWTDKQGKRREKNKKGFANKTLASHWERQTLTDIVSGKYDKTSSSTTLNELVDQWIDEYSRVNRATSVEKVRTFFDNHILTQQWFDKVQASSITQGSITEWLEHMAKIHSTYKKESAPFKHVLDLAVSHELLKENPFDKVRFPQSIAKPKHPGRVAYYDLQQLKAFIDVLIEKYGDTAYHKYAYLRLLAFTGMRTGEARALNWSDVHIDEEDPYITVNKTTSEVPGKGVVINPPKTAAGNRTVKLDQITAQVLRNWRAIQRKALFSRGLRSDIVWTNSRLDDRISSNQPRSWLQAAIKGTDIPEINIHGLRHTYITLSVQADMPIKTLQAQVGHTDISTTLGVYAAVTDDMRDQTVNIFTSVVNF